MKWDCRLAKCPQQAKGEAGTGEETNGSEKGGKEEKRGRMKEGYLRRVERGREKEAPGCDIHGRPR
jgi:hypothetical protein